MAKRLTVVEIAERLEVDREVARGLVRFLVMVGLAELRGERRPEGGRGKAENVYVFVEGFEKALVERLTEAELS